MMIPPEPSTAKSPDEAIDLDQVEQAIARLHRLTVYSRWLLVGGLWLTIGTLSLWGLRYPISLLQEHFTWATVRYGLANNALAAIGLGLCVGLTLAVLLWQSRNILFGLPAVEQAWLKKSVAQIKHQGETHPLWKWVWQKV